MFEWKNGYLYTNGAVLFMGSAGRTASMLVVVVAAMVVVVWEENVLFLPGWRGRKKKKIFPLEVSAPQSSQVCKAFTSQRYTLIFIKIRYN